MLVWALFRSLDHIWTWGAGLEAGYRVDPNRGVLEPASVVGGVQTRGGRPSPWLVLDGPPKVQVQGDLGSPGLTCPLVEGDRRHTLVSTVTTTLLRRPCQAEVGDVLESRQTPVGDLSLLLSSSFHGLVRQERPNEATPDTPLPPPLPRLIGMRGSSAGSSEGSSGEEREPRPSQRPL